MGPNKITIILYISLGIENLDAMVSEKNMFWLAI